MRARFAALTLLAVLSAGAARAENVGIDVAVDVADLDPMVTGLAIACMVCTVDCEIAGGAQVLGTGNASHTVPAAHAFKGTIPVSVPASSSKGTDYLCRMSVSDGTNVFVAGAGPDWTLPDEAQPFTNMLKGKLPGRTPVATKCAKGLVAVNGKCAPAANMLKGKLPGRTPVATKCAEGLVAVNGKCVPAANTAAQPAKTCPDGSPMPANGNCGFVGPAIDLGGIFKALTPCPGGQTRQPDGSCLPKTTTANQVPPALAPCPDGQPRLKTGLCPAAKLQPTFQLLRPFALPAPNNNGLH